MQQVLWGVTWNEVFVPTLQGMLVVPEIPDEFLFGNCYSLQTLPRSYLSGRVEGSQYLTLSVQKSIKTLVLSGVSAARSLCWNYIVLYLLPILRFLLSQRCSSQGLSSRKLPVQKPLSHTLFPREPSLRQCVNIICIYM